MTTTAAATLKTTLDKASPNNIADVLRQMKLGTILAPLKVAITGLTAAASFDLTSALAGATVVVNGTSLGAGLGAPVGSRLPAALIVKTLRVTASGTAGSIGSYVMGDVGATPGIPPTATGYAGAALGLATISDDGKTVTFPNTVTAFVIEYMPRSYTDMDTAFAVEG